MKRWSNSDVKRAATLVLVMLAMSASAAVDARVLAHEGQKTQWAPTRNFSSLNARAVFAGESRRATSPYAGEEWETAAGEKDWQYAAGNPTRFVDADGRGVADLQCIASGADGCNIFGAGRYAEFAFAVRDAKRRYARTQSVEDYKAWATISGRFEQRLLDLDERGATGPLYSGVAGVGVLVGGPALVAVGEALPAPGVLLSGAANVARGAANWAYQATVGPLVSGVRAFAGSAGSQGVMNAFRYIAGPFLAKFGLNIYDLFDESMSFSSPTGWFPGLHGSSNLKRVGENVLARKVEDLFPSPAVSPPRGAHLGRDVSALAARLNVLAPRRLRIRLPTDAFSEDERVVIKRLLEETNAALSKEPGMIGAAVPYRSELSTKFVRDLLFPGKALKKVRVNDAARALESTNVLNVDETRPRFLGGTQSFENQRLIDAMINSYLGQAEAQAAKGLPEGALISGFDVDFY